MASRWVLRLVAGLALAGCVQGHDVPREHADDATDGGRVADARGPDATPPAADGSAPPVARPADAAPPDGPPDAAPPDAFVPPGPASLVLVLDWSGSMAVPWGERTRLEAVRDGVTALLDAGVPLTLGLVVFDSEVIATVPLGGPREAFEGAVAREAGGATNFEAPLQAAADLLATRPDLRPNLLFVSDGEPNEGPAPSIQLADRLRADGVTIYTLSIADAGLATLRRLAGDDRRFFVAPGPDEFAAGFVTLAAEIAR
jgi:uncharacterized protein YegL